MWKRRAAAAEVLEEITGEDRGNHHAREEGYKPYRRGTKGIVDNMHEEE
jgi:hypothetical protein